SLICNNPAFLNISKHLQRPVWQQLAVMLEHLGCNGNGAFVGRFARQWGLGIGTVVDNKIEQLSGFKSCVGFLDGTDVVLEYKPLKDGVTYYNRKKKYALTV
ncbi:3217_t:CDS:2, partial [Gigaspora rosea]